MDSSRKAFRFGTLMVEKRKYRMPQNRSFFFAVTMGGEASVNT